MRISYVELKQYSNELHNACENINEILENFSQVKEKIVKSECWTGLASDYYVTKMRGLSNNFDEIFDELRVTALYLDKVLESYESVDDYVVTSVQAHQIGRDRVMSHQLSIK